MEHPTYNLTGKTTMIQGDKTGSESASNISLTLKPVRSNGGNGNTQGNIGKATPSYFCEDDSFVELGLLEKEFKKTYQMKSDDSSDNTSSEKDLFSVLRHRVRIKINNDKHLTDKHLVADIRQRNESLEELLRYAYILHLIEYGPQNQEDRSMRPEDEALINVISGLGFFQKSSVKHKIEHVGKKAEDEKQELHPLFSFHYETVGGLKMSTAVYSMSIFSQKRGRRSIIISADPSENDPFLLVTFGTEKSMKNLIRPSRNNKEDNLMKIMVAKQKQRGYKVLIVCKKGLSENQVMTYTKEFAKISSSARDQLEDLENLASQIENDLEFVGCIGLRDSIREEAIELTSELNKARITMSIMSGDELENCLTVVNKLGFSYIDIQNSSSYFSVNAGYEKGVMQQMRRIFDYIHDNLQTESYISIDNLLKNDRESLPESESKTNQEKKENQEHDEEKEVLSVGKKITTLDSMRNFKKPLLIGGAAVDCIMSYPGLVNHLGAIIHASGTIVAFDLMPKHKAFLIQVLRNCGEIVLAIGDGFNDIGMLNRANFGIQISNENVPLIFGDIVTPNLSNISPLLFEYGFNLKKNLLISMILVVWFSTLIAMFPLFMAYYTHMLPFFSLNALTIASVNLMYPVLIIFSVINTSYSRDLMKRIPAIYQENQILLEKIPNIMIMVAVWALLESTLITVPAIFFVGMDINNRLESSVVWNSSDLYVNYLVISLITKLIFLIRKRVAPIIWILIPGATMVMITIFGFDQDSRIFIGYSKWQSFSYLTFNISLIMLVLGENYLSYLVITYLKKRYFYPVSALFGKHSKEDEKTLTNDQVVDYLSELGQVSKVELHVQIINSIKKIFTEAKMMDPSLRRIINIDFHHSNMGLSSALNKILDNDERKRFLEFIFKNIDLKKSKYFFGILIILGITEWIIDIFVSKTDWPIGMNTMSPYFTCCMIVNFIMCFAKPKYLGHSFFGISKLLRFNDISCGIFCYNCIFSIIALYYLQ
jgi:magnesium-transporting ATPase (P-type)